MRPTSLYFLPPLQNTVPYLLLEKLCKRLYYKSDNTCLYFLPPLSRIQSPTCCWKKAVNAYTASQITLTIFYTTSCTAKPLSKGLNLPNLFIHFWNHYKFVTPSKIQYHINCNHISKTGQTNLQDSLPQEAWVQLNRL